MVESKCSKKINFLNNFSLVKGRIVISVLFLVLASFLIAEKSDAANLYLSPSSGSYTVGQTFPVTVFVGSGGQAMNAASGVVSFSASNLEVISISKASTIISLWVQEPTFSNTSGTVNFEGIVLNPGYNGPSGRMLTITFRAKAAGSASIRLSSGSILANDGEGTNILRSLGSATYQISARTETPRTPNLPSAPTPNLPSAPTPNLPSAPSTPSTIRPEVPTSRRAPEAPIIVSPSHPDQDKWYKNNNLKLSWRLPSGVTDISYELDRNSNTNPDFTTDKLVTEVSYEDLNLEDGVWYFHINFKNDEGWGELTHYKISIDKTPPDPLSINFQIESSIDPEPKILFSTNDKTSGIYEYEITISRDNWSQTFKTSENFYKLPPQKPGLYQIDVKAFDRAGNFSATSSKIEILSIIPPDFLEYDKTLRNNQYFKLEGTAGPRAIVRIFIKDEEGVLVATDEVISNAEGLWRYVYASFLKAGDYEVWAEAENEVGVISLPTEAIHIKVTSSVVLKLVLIITNYLSAILTLIAVITLLVLIISYALRRLTSWRLREKKLKENGQDEQEILSEFKLLYANLNNQVKDLEKRKILTKREKELINNLKNISQECKQLTEKVKKRKKIFTENSSQKKI